LAAYFVDGMVPGCFSLCQKIEGFAERVHDVVKEEEKTREEFYFGFETFMTFAGISVQTVERVFTWHGSIN